MSAPGRRAADRVRQLRPGHQLYGRPRSCDHHRLHAGHWRPGDEHRGQPTRSCGPPLPTSTRRGLPTSVVDVNGKTTRALRPAGPADQGLAEQPGHLGHAGPPVHLHHVQHRAELGADPELGPAGAQIASYQLFDGLLRARQTQCRRRRQRRPDDLDTTYDSRGLAAKASTFCNNASAPTSTLASFADTDVATQHRYTYDNLERQTVDAFWSGNGATSP